MNLHKHPHLGLWWPDGWSVRRIGEVLCELIVDDNVLIRLRPAVMPTVEHTEWIEGVMAEDLGPGWRAEKQTLEPGTNDVGLPVVFAHYQIFDAGGQLAGERAGAFYRVLHNNAEAVVRLSGGQRWADREAELRPIIMGGHVKWPVYEEDLLISLLGIRT